MIIVLTAENLTIEQKKYINKRPNLVKLNLDNVDDFNEIGEIDGLIIPSQIKFANRIQKLYNRILSMKLVQILWLDVNGILIQSDSNQKQTPSMLFIFPGSIVPLSMGSHQRAFNTLINLNRAGINLDILVPSGRNDSEVKQVLKAFSANVYFYKNNKKKFTKFEKIKRYIDQQWRVIQGKSKQLPDLFSERAKYKPTESLKRWVNRLVLAKNYTHIYVNYAWMLDCVEYITDSKKNFNLVCDTHDVQYYRNDKVLNRKERIFFDRVKERNIELKALSQADIVVAISPSDSDLLVKALPNSKIIKAYPGFDYALATIKCRVPGRPIHFGFIGGGMDANVRSVQYIIECWWPVIQKYSPDSKLIIAGSVCNNSYLIEQSFYNKNIKLLGFVKEIADFYKEIEVCLNPVVVPGGLNFKSVECVVAGRHLFTNELGAKCLGSKFPCVIINDEKAIINALNKIEFNPAEDKCIRSQNQKAALNLFNDLNFEQKLRTIINKE